MIRELLVGGLLCAGLAAGASADIVLFDSYGPPEEPALSFRPIGRTTTTLTDTQLAQRFTPTASGRVTTIEYRGLWADNDQGPLIAELWEVGGGLLGVSVNPFGSFETAAAAPGVVDFTGQLVDLVAGTQYEIRLMLDSPGSGSRGFVAGTYSNDVPGAPPGVYEPELRYSTDGGLSFPVDTPAQRQPIIVHAEDQPLPAFDLAGRTGDLEFQGLDQNLEYTIYRQPFTPTESGVVKDIIIKEFGYSGGLGSATVELQVRTAGLRPVGGPLVVPNGPLNAAPETLDLQYFDFSESGVRVQAGESYFLDVKLPPQMAETGALLLTLYQGPPGEVENGFVSLNLGQSFTAMNRFLAIRVDALIDQPETVPPSSCVADTTTTNTNPGDAGYGSPDGGVDGADLSYYVENWLAGCP